MKRRESIKNVMTNKVVSVTTQDSLMEAEKLFKKNHIRHIPVTEGKKIKGMLSYTDLLRISFVDSYNEEEVEVSSAVYDMLSIEQVMAKNVLTIPEESTVKDAAEILVKKEFHALPVTAENGNLVGIVTTTDIMQYLLDQY